MSKVLPVFGVSSNIELIPNAEKEQKTCEEFMKSGCCLSCARMSWLVLKWSCHGNGTGSYLGTTERVQAGRTQIVESSRIRCGDWNSFSGKSSIFLFVSHLLCATSLFHHSHLELKSRVSSGAAFKCHITTLGRQCFEMWTSYRGFWPVHPGEPRIKTLTFDSDSIMKRALFWKWNSKASSVSRLRFFSSTRSQIFIFSSSTSVDAARSSFQY